MKVVLINTSESKGGAAVACKRLYQALLNSGVDCKLLVMHKTSNDPNVILLPKSKIYQKFLKYLFIIELILQKIIKQKNRDFSLSLFGIDLSKIKEVMDADVVHLHWIHNSFIQIKGLDKLLNTNKKIIWTMHDMWAFTGGCHYSGSCEKFKSECKKCPQLKSNNILDIANKQFQKKSNLLLKNIIYITPSKWLRDVAKSSFLLMDASINAIPNCMEVKKYAPMSKEEALKILNLGIENDEKVFLFIAMNAEDPRKGFSILEESLKIWTTKYNQKATLLIVGRLTKDINVNSNLIKVKCLGRVFDQRIINAAYTSADVFLMPSQQDNLPNTIMESLTFGTPIVAFPIGGIPEMIIHEKTGYIANLNSQISFSEGIQWGYLNGKIKKDECREFAINNYDFDLIARKHIELYEEP